MPLSLDHVFICPENPQAAERELSDFGLQFSRRGIHRGQGTANACAFFDNAYLELLWRHNDDELQSEVVAPVGLWQRVRWRETGASPFGVAFRPENSKVPVETWPYEAPFLPAGANIPIVTPRFRWREPLTFISLVSQEPATLPSERRPPLDHRGERHRLTAVTLYCPEPFEASVGFTALCGLGLLAFKTAGKHHLELEFDGAKCGERHDFRPTLPMSLQW
jgi:glyoxalase-like protein